VIHAGFSPSRLGREPRKRSSLSSSFGWSSSSPVFGLFAPHNWTSAVVLTLCALAVAGAVAGFLELEQGFGQLIRVSPEPMRQAVRVLQVEQEKRTSSVSESRAADDSRSDHGKAF